MRHLVRVTVERPYRRDMEELKLAAAERAVEDYVESGMVVGLGTGSTAAWAVRTIAERLRRGELAEIKGVATSERTAALARELGVPLTSLEEDLPALVLDGADEIGPDLSLIKGMGGALLREKIVAFAVGTLIVVADDSKLVETLGRGPLPVEVEPFGWRATRRALASLGCEAELRTKDGSPAITDGNHYTIDCRFVTIPDPGALETEIRRIPGAIESGLFVGSAQVAVVAGSGGIEVLET